MTLIKQIVAVVILSGLANCTYPENATAQSNTCPKVGKIADYNCDGEARVVVLGDSIPFGFGDTENNNRGGYVLRAQKKLPGVTFSNFGVQGLKSRDLVLDVQRAFDGRGDADLAEALVKADVVFLDLGRNDRWDFGLPSTTFRNLKRAATLIKKKVAEVVEKAPVVVIDVLMLPNRGSQGPWVKELNAIILKSHSTKNPANLRFDLVSKRLLADDQIHPTSEGYKALAAVFVKYLLTTYGKIVEKLGEEV